MTMMMKGRGAIVSSLAMATQSAVTTKSVQSSGFTLTVQEIVILLKASGTALLVPSSPKSPDQRSSNHFN